MIQEYIYHIKGKKEMNLYNDLVSIIIPIYNAEKYLDRCVNSVVNQTYQNLEIILVNDGSADASKEICVKWRERDERIVYLEQENRGVSAARNMGLKAAAGKYISFVDADDWLDVDFYSYLLNLLKETHSQLVFCGIMQVYGDKYVKEPEMENIVVLSSKELTRELVQQDRTISLYVCNKLFDRSILGEQVFDESIYYMEDELFMWQLLQKCSKVVVTNQKKYYYFQHSGSSVHSEYSYKMHSGLKAMKIIMENYIEDDNLQMYEIEYISKLIEFVKMAVRLSDAKKRKHWFEILCVEIEKYGDLIPYLRKKSEYMRGKLLLFSKKGYYISERLVWKILKYRQRTKI